MSDIKGLTERLIKCRADILNDYPFFGRLILRMPLAFANCGTACTDMQRIIFDPEFAERLDGMQMKFVLLHELLHCVLKHCIRGDGLDKLLYNISCDIVVNSLILEMFGLQKIEIDGAEMMNKAPDGTDGRLHSAEEVYYQFLKNMQDKDGRAQYKTFDSHSLWDKISRSDAARLSDEWNRNIREAAGNGQMGAGGISLNLQRYIRQINDPKTDWKQILQDFIRYDRADFSYSRPDSRYQGDVIMPSFLEDQYGERVENVWVLIDTSGSVSDEGLSRAYSEIRGAVEQLDSLEGKLSFFNTSVTEPIEFTTVEELDKIKPGGSGGTSFEAIFEYMRANMRDDLPALIMILTDGYADFPPEEAAMEVPVLWIIIDSKVEPPWGEVGYVD